MKKFYEKPVSDIQEFEFLDVVATSGDVPTTRDEFETDEIPIP